MATPSTLAAWQWYTPKPTRDYERRVRFAAVFAAGFERVPGPLQYGFPAMRRRAVVWPLAYEGPVEVEVTAYMPDKRARDADNVLKSCLDGIQHGVIANDKQVKRAGITMLVDREKPRLEVVVRMIEASNGT